jgi:hypothetical protein
VKALVDLLEAIVTAVAASIVAFDRATAEA